jgi:alpha-L-rhamnosidase
MYQTILGIVSDPAQPGYRAFSIHPQPGGGVTQASGSLQSPYGKISTSWRYQGRRFVLSIAVPPNTTATVYIPAASADHVTAPSSARFLSLDGHGDTVYSVGPGHYTFTTH